MVSSLRITLVTCLLVVAVSLLQIPQSCHAHSPKKKQAGSGKKKDYGLNLLPLDPVVNKPKKGKKPRLPTVDASKMTPQMFFTKYVSESIPVIIKNGMKEWGVNKWTDKYLRKKIGHLELEVEVSQDDNFVFYGKKFAAEPMLISDFLDKYNSTTREKNYYIAQQDMIRDVRPLLSDIKEPAFTEYLEKDETLFWMGNGGQVTPLHYDDAENIMAVVSGKKKFTLFDPAQSNFLYPIERSKNGGLTTQINITHPNFEKFPLYKKALEYKIEAEVGPGDLFYLPAYWWHQVESSGRNIAVNFWYMCHSTVYFNFMSVFEDKVVRRTRKYLQEAGVKTVDELDDATAQGTKGLKVEGGPKVESAGKIDL